MRWLFIVAPPAFSYLAAYYMYYTLYMYSGYIPSTKGGVNEQSSDLPSKRKRTLPKFDPGKKKLTRCRIINYRCVDVFL